jgi:disulfide oxidoreductase YuzD
LQDVIELAMRRREFVKEYQDIKNKPENTIQKNLLEKNLQKKLLKKNYY